MPKGDDAVRKKKNKILRKRLNSDPSTVPARIAAIIAAKQRRKNGKRRMCEGMCFSLPTPEDPFNDRYSDKDPTAKKKKPNDKVAPASSTKKTDALKTQEVKGAKQGGLRGKAGPLPEDLVQYLKAMQRVFVEDGIINKDKGKAAAVNAWGAEFWGSCSAGMDILESTGACSTSEQIAWIVSTAAAIFGRKEKKGLSSASPFLLFLVPSQEKAVKVRSVCKALKPLGIHTVSLHPGASLDHQIQGLRDCEPQFLVSTPERLLELVSLKAIDISGVSLLVVDGLECFPKDGLLDKIVSIKQSISGDPQSVILDNSSDHATTSVVQNLLGKSICRMSLTDSIASQVPASLSR